MAFLTVFVAHARIFPGFPGNFGVTMFFFLSGFLITTLMRLEHEETGRISLKQFYLRRVLRIFPPFYLILGSTVLLVHAGVFDGDAALHPVTAQALHFSNYWLIFKGWLGYPLGTYAYWSLAVEEHFYLVFPLVYIGLRRFLPGARRQATFLLAICTMILLWRIFLVFHFHPIQDRTYIATDTRFDSILFGCVLAIWGNPALDGRWMPERWLKWLFLPLSVIVLLITFTMPTYELRETVRYTMQGVALVPVFIAMIQYPSWGPFKLLNLRFVQFVGLLSYSLYLMHEIIIVNLYPKLGINRPLQAAVTLAVCVLIATALYHFIERPCARLRKRLTYRRRAAAA